MHIFSTNSNMQKKINKIKLNDTMHIYDIYFRITFSLDSRIIYIKGYIFVCVGVEYLTFDILVYPKSEQ